MDKEVISIAYRPRLGPTGGPGGVLFVQEYLLGQNFEGTHLRYEYKSDTHAPSYGRYIRFLKKLICKVGMGNNHFDSILWAFSLGKSKSNARFIVHEPVSAFGLALAGCKYTLIYHQQGSLVADLEGLGRKFNRRQKGILNFIEKIALRRAVKVYFPSLGAQNVYVATSAAIKTILPNFCPALYNTILPDENPVSDEDLETLASIETKGIIFLSVGALTTAKGVDRVPRLLDQFKKKVTSNFTWIAVGSGPLELESEIEKYDLSENTILIKKRLGHPAIIRLMELADCYVMLHRRAIFDFATLEAMRAGCAIILSNTDGNPEFNVQGNVLLVNDDNQDEIAERLAHINLKEIGKINKKVFEGQFSSDNFIDSYQKLIRELLAS